MAHVSCRHPIHVWFLIHGLRLAKIDLPTEFEVSISIQYQDMKDDTICEKSNGLG